MKDDLTRSEGTRERGPREARETDPRRDGARGGAMTSGTRTTDTAGAAGTIDTHTSAGAPGTHTATGAPGTHAAVAAGHDTAPGRTPGPADGHAEGRADGRAPGLGGGRGRGEHGKAPTGGTTAGASLLPHDECDKLSLRLHDAVGGFVDEPRSAVEEADHVLEDVAARFAEAVTQRRRTLRASWHTTADDRAASTDTEQLRLALRDYRELTERLLRL
ncbi:hypothetical protein [Streptomyces sp. NPDC012510]|uniref:hypothetical protein n=1 Tax=Streptomyces sp. NPDC012510 TaxID=3364838 RepID=UPI0036EECC82